MENKHLYYTVAEENETLVPNLLALTIEFNDFKTKLLNWKIPIRQENCDGVSQRRRILLSHDETCHKSGEMSRKRWFFPNNRPFYSKGKGRSIMVSDFIVQFPGDYIIKLRKD